MFCYLRWNSLISVCCMYTLVLHALPQSPITSCSTSSCWLCISCLLMNILMPFLFFCCMCVVRCALCSPFQSHYKLSKHVRENHQYHAARRISVAQLSRYCTSLSLSSMYWYACPHCATWLAKNGEKQA